MEVYIVVNRVMSGREALGIFSSWEKAQSYMDRYAGKTGYFCGTEKSFVRGYYEPPHHVFAAHTYDRHEDVHVLEGSMRHSPRLKGPQGQKERSLSSQSIPRRTNKYR